jgi:hypothetical protein
LLTAACPSQRPGLLRYLARRNRQLVERRDQRRSPTRRNPLHHPGDLAAADSGDRCDQIRSLAGDGDCDLTTIGGIDTASHESLAYQSITQPGDGRSRHLELDRQGRPSAVARGSPAPPTPGIAPASHHSEPRTTTEQQSPQAPGRRTPPRPSTRPDLHYHAHDNYCILQRTRAYVRRASLQLAHNAGRGCPLKAPEGSHRERLAPRLAPLARRRESRSGELAGQRRGPRTTRTLRTRKGTMRYHQHYEFERKHKRV